MLNGPGIILQQTREKLGYTINDIHDATKIKKDYIEGLESNDISVFPAELYYKNFLKSYAIYLELNPNELIQIYEQNKMEHQKNLFEQKNDTENKFICSYKKNKKMFVYIGFCVIAVCLIGIIISVLNKTIQEQININTDTVDITNKKIQEQQTNTKEQETNISNIIISTSSQKIVPASTEVKRQTKRIKQKLYIKALADTWIKIMADNKEIFKGTVTKYFEAKANDGFIIKIGNIDNVEVYFNGMLVNLTADETSLNRAKTITLKRSQD